jgi:hypothetical protein
LFNSIKYHLFAETEIAEDREQGDEEKNGKRTTRTE